MSIIGILKIMEVQEDDMEVQEEAVQESLWRPKRNNPINTQHIYIYVRVSKLWIDWIFNARQLHSTPPSCEGAPHVSSKKIKVSPIYKMLWYILKSNFGL